MNITLKEELTTFWNKSKLHLYRLLAGFGFVLLLMMGGWITVAAVSYLLGMLFVKAK